jgi:Fe2+ transport system protein FeoA
MSDSAKKNLTLRCEACPHNGECDPAQCFTLNTCRVGQRACVKTVSSSNRSLCSRLLSMGIVAGTIVEVLRIAPLGDPIKIKAMGYKLSLRKSEAASIEVTPLQ